MVRHRKTQPLEKTFGEQLTIKKPDLTSKIDIGVEGDQFDQRYVLMPELPSHIPTPATIDQGLEGIQRQFETMFTEDDGVTTPTKKRNRRKKNAKEDIEQQHAPLHAPGTPDHSPYSTKALKILIASPYGSKWGPEVWKSKMQRSFSRPDQANTAPPSPSSSAGESVNTRDQVESPINSPKLIMSEDAVETVEREYSPLNRKKHAASPLQLRWIEQNALNLHSSCENLHEQTSRRRSRFFRSRRRSTASFE